MTTPTMTASPSRRPARPAEDSRTGTRGQDRAGQQRPGPERAPERGTTRTRRADGDTRERRRTPARTGAGRTGAGRGASPRPAAPRTGRPVVEERPARATAARPAPARTSGARPGTARPAPDATGAPAPGTAPFVMLIMVALAAGLVATLWLSTAAAADSYRLQDDRQALRDLSEQAEGLHRDVEAMQSAPAIAAGAQRIGMVPAPAPAVLVVRPDGSSVVVGTPTPAPAPAPAPAPPAAVPAAPAATTAATTAAVPAATAGQR